MCFFKKKKKEKKVETKKVVVETKESKVEVTKSEPVKKPEGKRVYHVSKREDGMWQVKFANGQKAIKLFKTKVEAEEYTKQMAENQGGVMLSHNSKGANKGRIAKK